MTPAGSNQGSQAAYDLWLGLISQFLGLLGSQPLAGGAGTDARDTPPEGLQFPIDQIAKSANMTRQWLNNLSRFLTPVLQAGNTASLLRQWTGAMPGLERSKTVDALSAAADVVWAPWAAFFAGAMPAAAAATPSGALAQAPLQSVHRAWTEMTSKFTGASPAQVDTAFDRAFGALSDGLGLGPARKLQGAWRDVLSAGMAQQDARAHYATLVQGAFTQGYQRLLQALAGKADADEHVDSVFALIRLWVFNTEQAAHETLQSEQGLAATATLMRADTTYRKKMQQAAAVLADQVDIATRHDLDEAFREIQALKRELRHTRAAIAASAAATSAAAASAPAAAPALPAAAEAPAVIAQQPPAAKAARTRKTVSAAGAKPRTRAAKPARSAR